MRDEAEGRRRKGEEELIRLTDEGKLEGGEREEVVGRKVGRNRKIS